MVLDNKLGVKDSAELAREEERISKKKAVELFEQGMLDKLEAGTFSTLQVIHKYLFDEIIEKYVEIARKIKGLIYYLIESSPYFFRIYVRKKYL